MTIHNHSSAVAKMFSEKFGAENFFNLSPARLYACFLANEETLLDPDSERGIVVCAPDNGCRLKIDGIDIREIEKSHLRSSIGVVLQENYFFHGTVRENISLTRPSATAEEIMRAAAMAGAHDFIQTLPQGYETVLEENASNLSDGGKIILNGQELSPLMELLDTPP